MICIQKNFLYIRRYCGYWTILQVYCPGGPNENSHNNLPESVSESNPNEIRPVRDNCLGILKRGGLTGARVIGFLPISGSFVFGGPSGETTATNQYRPKKVEIFFDPFSGNRSPAIGRSADRERFRPITEERTNSFVFARAKRAGWAFEQPTLTVQLDSAGNLPKFNAWWVKSTTFTTIPDQIPGGWIAKKIKNEYPHKLSKFEGKSWKKLVQQW